MKWDTFIKDGYTDTSWCKAIQVITRVSTGESIEKVVDCCYSPEENGPNSFIFTDGNFSCDCYRREDFEDDSDDCTDDEYSLQLLHPSTREIYLND